MCKIIVWLVSAMALSIFCSLTRNNYNILPFQAKQKEGMASDILKYQLQIQSCGLALGD